MMQPETSDFVLSRKSQVCLEKSSTTVRKYLWPLTEVTESGPHISMCNNSNIHVDFVLLKEYGSFLCLAKGQILQESLHFDEEMKGNLVFNEAILFWEGCLNLKCHLSTMEVHIQVEAG